MSCCRLSSDIMASERKVNDEPLSPREIGFKLRQQTRIMVSPINLSLTRAEIIKAERLQWCSFSEPPSKLVLRNSGNAIKIQGRWPQRRPTLSGGPLDGVYQFSQIHFHHDSPSHAHNTHTINGQSCPLEMHGVFYNSSYKTPSEALGQDDGIVIVVYFFKVESQSGMGWLTEHLQRVTHAKTTAQLPSVPLTSILAPFTRDYLAYWGALPCTCHRVLWLLSRTPLRITSEEIVQFRKMQTDLKDGNDEETKTEKGALSNIYLINPSTGSQEVIFSDPIDPPLQIFKMPKGTPSDHETLKEINENICINKELQEVLVKLQPEVREDGCTLQEKCVLKQDLCLKSELHPCETNNQSLISKLKNCNSENIGNLSCNVTNTSELENDQASDLSAIHISGKEHIQNNKRVNLLKFCREEEELSINLLDSEVEAANSSKVSVEGELKDALSAESKENTSNDFTKDAMHIPHVLNNLTSDSNSVSTSEPTSVLVDQNNLSEQENVGIYGNKPISGDCGDCENIQSGTAEDEFMVKERKECKKKTEITKSKVPVRKFTGLKSSLTPYFSEYKTGMCSKKQDTPASDNTSTQIPRLNYKPSSKSGRVQQTDLGGKGDHPTNTNNQRREHKKSSDSGISTGILTKNVLIK